MCSRHVDEEHEDGALPVDDEEQRSSLRDEQKGAGLRDTVVAGTRATPVPSSVAEAAGGHFAEKDGWKHAHARLRAAEQLILCPRPRQLTLAYARTAPPSAPSRSSWQKTRGFTARSRARSGSKGCFYERRLCASPPSRCRVEGYQSAARAGCAYLPQSRQESRTRPCMGPNTC